MPPLNLAEQEQHLRDLAMEFDALRTRIRDLSYTPGSDALRQIGPLLVKSQELTATTLVRLSALDGSAFTEIAGSRASLDCLASVVAASSLAANDLAHALEANPYDGAPFPGYPADDEAVRTARRTEAAPRLAEHLANAAYQCEMSLVGCNYLVRHIATAQEQAKPTQPTTDPELTAAQYDALKALSPGDGRLYESSQRGMGRTRVAAPDGTRVSITTFRVLAKHGFVAVDTSTPLFHLGQKITVTEQGQQALAKGRPAAARAATAVATPRPVSAPRARR
ncbi:hypothetical protein [Streptomyces sp. NPDC018059]|uniref:hypothetical protein n=1 Tax=Streptomyces sp. NPDC018059 TaxID=3365041 RepID=UPI0037BCD64C